ncbi:MAG: MgtC/SapB family protein [Patescibacteria group bacterium]
MNFFTLEKIDIIIKLLLAVFLAGIIGIERQRAQKAAGFRTYGLVGLGACMLTLVSVSAFDKYIGLTNFDPSRIISNIVVSIGFIGAGIIFHQGIKVEGLTTAAGIWLAAIIGIAIGMEFYFLAIAGTVITFVIMGILRKFKMD